ncbi:hypothetical protein E6Q11_03730 [Candidatus Dojkabacteria bacterium]|uniref:Uncharacterized protein n=1 Tax=Candidatus Dojkabacteria bacterium TaxID=2099670 RepID=A0A5C7J633_9BACT|nr:MAG: hypothetical protein E6Q11_03730 [Candidatus Dojkabacteria bacterium]
MSSHKRIGKRTLLTAVAAGLTVACVVIAIFLPILDGKTPFESLGLGQTPGFGARKHPDGKYVDHRVNKTSDDEESVPGLVLRSSSSVDSLNDTSDKLKKYLKSTATRGDSTVVFATYDDYAIGESDNIGTLWGPGSDDSIEVLLYTDLGLYSCSELIYKSIPAELINGDCAQDDGSSRWYK